MDALSPARTCDPWAVHSAKSLAREQGGRVQLSETQQKILEILEETGGIQPPVLAERLQMKLTDLERDIAALRHMEKLRGEMREDKKVFLVLW
jgi:predicted HTH transcriptional regulator